MKIVLTFRVLVYL